MKKIEFILQSMTGFGQATGTVDRYRVRIEVRSVNHRYADVSIKLAREWAFLDEPIRKAVLQKIKRGRIELGVTIEREHGAEASRRLLIDWPLVQQYVDAGKQLQQKTGVEGSLTVQELLMSPELVRFEEQHVADAESFKHSFLSLLDKALQQLLNMRLREGAYLQQDLLNRSQRLQQILRSIEQKSAHIVVIVRDRLRDRIQELLDDIVELDEQRILTEAAIYADKADIAEEITRLNSHLRQLSSLLNVEEPVGRKLDFLVQEIHRELTTIGSKTVQTEVVKDVIEMKSELERVREQVQNIQ